MSTNDDPGNKPDDASAENSRVKHSIPDESESQDDSLVPEDFDLSEALHQRSTTPDEEHPRCPDCGSIDLKPRSGFQSWQHDGGLDYYCDRCNKRVNAAEPMTDGGENPIRCCPACDSGRIRRCSNRNGATHDANWRCRGCGNTFDDPDERPAARSGGGGRRGLAGMLADPEVNSIPKRDDEPVTDGGTEDAQRLINALQRADRHAHAPALLQKVADESDPQAVAEVAATVEQTLREECLQRDLSKHAGQAVCYLVVNRLAEAAPADSDDQNREAVTDGGHHSEPDPSPRYEQTDHEIGTADVVVDLVSGKSLQVVSRSSVTAGDHPQLRSDKTGAMFGADENDAVYNCVYLPDGEDVRPPSKTYAYPESRLLRYPVEDAADGTHLQTHLRATFLEDLAEAADDQARLSTLYNIVKEAYTEDLAEHIHEWAEAAGGEDD